MPHFLLVATGCEEKENIHTTERKYKREREIVGINNKSTAA
jgi:hypothetical protein